MFSNLIRVISDGRKESVKLQQLWEDIEYQFIDCELWDTPDVIPSYEWLKTTEWYNTGGFELLLAAELKAGGDPMVIWLRDGEEAFKVHMQTIKDKWPMPIKIDTM